MAVSGFQDFWTVGTRFYFRRDKADGSGQEPWIDLGVIQSTSPTFATEKVTLKDADGGIKITVAEALSETTESYDITCSNMSMVNASLFFLADPPSAYTTTATQYGTVSWGFKHGALCAATTDGLYNSEGTTRAQNLTHFFGASVADGTGPTPDTLILGIGTIAGIDTSGVITLNSPIAAGASTDFASGDRVIILDTNADFADTPGTYTLSGGASGGGPWTIPLSDWTGKNETFSGAGNGSMFWAQGAQKSVAGIRVLPRTAWEANLARGFVSFSEDTALISQDESDNGFVGLYFKTAAVSGFRQINPQTASEIKGDAELWLSRGSHADETKRACRVSISPASADWSIEDFSSMVFTVTVLSDTSLVAPAGTLTMVKGDLPTRSGGSSI